MPKEVEISQATVEDDMQDVEIDYSDPSVIECELNNSSVGNKQQTLQNIQDKFIVTGDKGNKIEIHQPVTESSNNDVTDITDEKTEGTIKSRELKSLLELSKEANLDVNITHKRRIVETSKLVEGLLGKDGLLITGNNCVTNKKQLSSTNAETRTRRKSVHRTGAFTGEAKENISMAVDKNPGETKFQGETPGGAVDIHVKKVLKPVLATVVVSLYIFMWNVHEES